MSGSERWSALEIRLLVAFVAVVDEGSFTAAAHRLGYTQSGISQQIAALERIVDRKLLVRQSGGRRPIELTADGETLLRHARILLGQLDRAFAEITGAEEELAATVPVVSFPSAAVHLVPSIERVLRAETTLRLELQEAFSEEELLAALESRRAELAFGTLPVASQFVAEELGSDPYVAVVAAGSRLAGKREIEIGELVDEPLLTLPQSAEEDVIEARLAAGGVDPSAFRRYANNRLIQTLVRSGNGIAIVPSLTIWAEDEGVHVLKIRADLPPRVIALVQVRDALLSPAAREFKRLAVPVCRRVLATTPFAWEQAVAS